MESRVPVRVLSSRQGRLVKVAPRLKDVSIMGGKTFVFLRTSTWHLHARAHTAQRLRGFTICKCIQKSRRLPPHKHNPCLFVLQRRPTKQIYSLRSDCGRTHKHLPPSTLCGTVHIHHSTPHGSNITLETRARKTLFLCFVFFQR